MAKPILFEPVENPYLVPFDGSFKIKKAHDRARRQAVRRRTNVEALEEHVEKLAEAAGASSTRTTATR